MAPRCEEQVDVAREGQHDAAYDDDAAAAAWANADGGDDGGGIMNEGQGQQKMSLTSVVGADKVRMMVVMVVVVKKFITWKPTTSPGPRRSRIHLPRSRSS